MTKKLLPSAFKQNVGTQLLCSIHLKKNIENKLVGMGITGKIKEEIVANIFDQQVGDVYEHGLSDAEVKKVFLSKGVVKGKWSKCHVNVLKFFSVVCEKQRKENAKPCDCPSSSKSRSGLPSIQVHNKQIRKDKRCHSRFY